MCAHINVEMILISFSGDFPESICKKGSVELLPFGRMEGSARVNAYSSLRSAARTSMTHTHTAPTFMQSYLVN